MTINYHIMGTSTLPSDESLRYYHHSSM